VLADVERRMEDETEKLYFSEEDVNGYPLQTRASFFSTCILTDAVLYSMSMLMSVALF
jgi:hypothetical protein